MKWKTVLATAALAIGLAGVSSSVASGDQQLTDHTAAQAVSAAQSASAAQARSVAVTSTPELLYVPVQPCRAVDTRASGGKIGPGGLRSYYIAGPDGFPTQGGKSGGCDVPTGAKAFTGTMIVVESEGIGYLRSWPYGSAAPTATTLNYGAGNASTGFTTPIRSGGGRDLYVRNFGTTTHLVIDVTGYYIPQMQAYINSNGAVLDQSGRLTSITHPSTGYYVLTWDRDVNNCSGQVSSDLAGHIASVYTTGSQTQVRIDNHAGSAANYYFNIVVNC